MASYNELNALIDAYINRNGVQAITGQILNGVLKAMVEQLGRGYSIMGAATPTTDPGTPDAPECYFASETGTYTDFDGLQIVPGELALLCYTPTDGWTKATIYEGFQEVQATIDGNVGTPSVGVSYADGVLSFDFHNMKGATGDPAGFGTVNATVDGNIGTPGVSVQTSGPDTAKNLTFAFTNLKGEAGVTSVVATVDNTTGTPACTVSLVGQQLTLAFSGLKGAQGDTGSSVDYPFTIVNNLTTNDATQALSAAMGVQLESEVSQLEADLTDLDEEINGIPAVNITGAIPMVGGQGNTKSTGAKCDVPIPAGTYHFSIDTNYIGSNAVVYAIINGAEVTIGYVTNINNRDITISEDATGLSIWANAANSPATGDCQFSLSQDGEKGITDDIAEVNARLSVIAGEVDGNNTDTYVEMNVDSSAQADTVKTTAQIKAGDYYVDIINPSIFSVETYYVTLYAWTKDGVKITLGKLSPNCSKYWGPLDNEEYIREVSFSEDIVALSMFRSANTFATSGKLKLQFVDKNRTPSIKEAEEKIAKRANSPQKVFHNSGELGGGEVLTTPEVVVIKNTALSVQVNGISLPLRIGVGYSRTAQTHRNYNARWIEITETDIKLYSFLNDTSLLATYQHGLSLDDKTMVSLIHQDSGTALRVYNKLGDIYENNTFDWWGVGQPFVENGGEDDIEVQMNFQIGDICKNIWIIGDSYCGLNNMHRWPTQLVSFGINNFLMCARGGEAADSAFAMLENLFTLGKIPSFVLWAIGGNGSGDTPGGDVAGFQKLYLWKLSRLAWELGFEIILTTVPSFESAGRKHEAYNAYVKGLGYRYIDVAKAIGSQPDGSAYPGMFEPDNIHPSETGARVIAQQVLIDFPEIQMKEN